MSTCLEGSGFFALPRGDDRGLRAGDDKCKGAKPTESRDRHIWSLHSGTHRKDSSCSASNLLQHCLNQYTGIRIPRAHYEDLIHRFGLSEAHHRQHIAGEANHWLHGPRKFDKAIQNLVRSGHPLDIMAFLSKKPNLGMGCINGKGFEDIRDGFHSHTCKCGSCPVSLGLGHKPWRVSFQCNSLLQSVMQSCCGELSPSSDAAPQTTGRAVAIQSGARACPSVELRSK